MSFECAEKKVEIIGLHFLVSIDFESNDVKSY